MKIWPLYVFIAFYLTLSLLTFKDFGITLDEPRQYFWGNEMREYLSKKTTYKNTIAYTYNQEPKNQRHTPILSSYYRGYTALLAALNPSQSYERYHFLNMVCVIPLFIAAYLFLFTKYGNKWSSLLGPSFILLIPRFFGHIPANPKDVPFATAYLISLFLIYVSPKIKNSNLKILILGLSFGLTQSLRIVGFSIYLVYILYFIFVAKRDWVSIKNFLFQLLFMGFVADFFMLATWPYLGSNFTSNFIALLNNSSNFEAWDKSFLFMGNLVDKTTRPWYYLPVFIIITTPIFILVNSFVTTFTLKKPLKNNLILLLLLTLGSNFAIYLIVSPNIYNGLRHFLYLLPILGVLSAVSFIEVSRYKFKYVIYTVTFISVVSTIYSIIKLHPYQYAYFNSFVKNPRGKYEVEYWGASYKEGIEWLENNRELNNKKINVCNGSAAAKYYLRGIADYTDNQAEADYFLCDAERYSYPFDKSLQKYVTIHEIRRLGVTYNYINENPK